MDDERVLRFPLDHELESCWSQLVYSVAPQLLPHSDGDLQHAFLQAVKAVLDLRRRLVQTGLEIEDAIGPTLRVVANTEGDLRILRGNSG